MYKPLMCKINVAVSVIILSIWSPQPSLCDFDIWEGETITSPKVTDWGDNHGWKYCRLGHYAKGFELQTDHSPTDAKDATGLNAIKLLCVKPGSQDIDSEVLSNKGIFGHWGNRYLCGPDELITGFQLQSQADQGPKDDTAANNLKVFCSNPRVGTGPVTEIQGDGTALGSWTAAQQCSSEKAVCGILVKVQSRQGPGDDSALNNVNMECCFLPDSDHFPQFQ